MHEVSLLVSKWTNEKVARSLARPIRDEEVAEKATKYVGLTKRLSTTIAKDPQESRIMRNIESKSVQRCQMAFDFDSSIYIVYNSH